MPELLVRFGAIDAALADRVLTGSAPRRPSRVVVDAHVAASRPTIAMAAGRAGIPFLVDPQTFFLQHEVHPDDAWARLPFASGRLSADEIALPRQARSIAEEVIDFQLAHGASHVMVPYLHIARRGQGWESAQIALWNATRRVLDNNGLDLPVVATVALGWRNLGRNAWPSTLLPLMTALNDLDPDEVTLAASRVDDGVQPQNRLVDMLAVIERLAIDHPVIAWQQGTLGEAAVLAGAVGYETGIGWRERCDLQTKMRSRASAPTSGGSARPVYVPSLRRGIDQRTLAAVLGTQRLQAGLVCLDVTCCPDGPGALLADARQHSINARITNLARTVAPTHATWRWAQLADDSSHGLELARRVNSHLKMTGVRTPAIRTEALQAMHMVAARRRASRHRYPAA